MQQSGSLQFHDRRDAGRRLATRLLDLAERPDVVILALPRGGVPVAIEVARALRQPLDLFLVRKLGVPGHPEVAMGAVASGGLRWLNRELIAEQGIPPHLVEATTQRETAELDRREKAYRRGRPSVELAGKTIVLVDDGIATGATMLAALSALRLLHPARLIVAAPVIAAGTRVVLRAQSDRVECVEAPVDFLAVGVWYRNFEQVSDDEVVALLDEAHFGSRQPSGARRARTVRIPVTNGVLTGDLELPSGPVTGLVVFVHGSGSSRLSPRNREVARSLRERGFATLLFDLLTGREEEYDRATADLRFDIPLLAKRLAAVTDWIATDEAIRALPIGYFGASTGAAAALVAAAERGRRVHAVVSRGGRPDLAGPALDAVTAPTLLIVGGEDPQVLELNRAARARMAAAHVELAIVPGASHLFEEPGAMSKVMVLAGDWFATHLAPHEATTPVTVH